MNPFLHRHRFDILLAIICVLDVAAMSRFPSLCGMLTGVAVVAMIMDHRKQEAKMGKEDL